MNSVTEREREQMEGARVVGLLRAANGIAECLLFFLSILPPNAAVAFSSVSYSDVVRFPNFLSKRS